MNYKRLKESKSVRFVCYITILIVSQFFFTQSGGIMLTVPLCAVLPAVATLFYNKRRLTVVTCALLSLFFNLISTNDFETAKNFAVASAVFAFAGIFVKRLVVTSALRVSGKRALYILVAAALSFGIVAFYAELFGNPIAAAKAKGENLRYVQSLYGDGFDYESEYTIYDYRNGRYITSVSFYDGKKQIADISYREGMNSAETVDEIREYYEGKLKEVYRAEIYKATSIENAELSVAKIAQEAIITPDTRTTDITHLASLEVYFRKELATQADFERECKSFVGILEESSIAYRSIVLRGGSAGEILYEEEISFADAQENTPKQYE